jgi:acyl-homoserine lactone acylase PvdQ
MPKHLALAALLFTLCAPAFAATPPADLARYRAEATHVTITRDDWGIAHIHGHTDADAVFGMIYAQCEDDFNRVERNYLTALGRTAEADGPSALWQDLRQRLFIDPAVLQHDYATSPAWLQSLMNAWADGANFYLATHPGTHPLVLTHFEPWMALSFTEGSIGGDIERVNLRQLEAFYSSPQPTSASTQIADPEEEEAFALQRHLEEEPSGSNGIAIAPSNTLNHHALLLINPHTSFFFRSELQMSSDEGLNAYGAVTWGQFFIYQGFNERAGWMHTSSGVDAVDEYLETITPDHKHYRYGADTRPLLTRPITIAYKTPSGIASRTFIAYFTSHGPITHEQDGRWVSIQLMNTPTPALEQSWLRTKAHTYADYKKTMALMANSSNNTIFADADGDIAYWHGNFIPRRDTHFDYTHPVDGSNPAADWHGLLTLDQVPHLFNPASGFLFNVNNAPWWGSGISSLKQSDFPAYVEQGTETARGLHAIRVLETPGGEARTNFTLDTLLAAAFDSYLPWFDKPIPALTQAFDALPPGSPQRSNLGPQVAMLSTWDHRWSAESPATSLAVFWGEELRRRLNAEAHRLNLPVEDLAAQPASASILLDSLAAASGKLTADFGSWQTPWGSINRFQRLTSDIAQPFNDDAPSYPVPFTSSIWGSLASFGARAYPGTKKWYGTSGNSFVAVVEFGPRIHARAVTAGGESGHPSSPHFIDEVPRYASGNLREVYFYPDQLTGHTERTYHPGSESLISK